MVNERTKGGAIRGLGNRKGTTANLVHTFAFIAILLIPLKTVSQEPDLKFEHFTVEHGLSSNGVFGIFQDTRGFMWFGTNDGLNKYDGYSFTVYKHDPLDSNSIPGSNTPVIDEDRSGTFWIRGPGGPSFIIFDRAIGKFRRSGFSAVWSEYPDIYEDVSGVVWIAEPVNGLRKFNRASGTFVHHTVSSDTVYALCGDPDEDARILWVGTPSGLDRFDKTNLTFTHYDHGSRNIVHTIHADQSGVLWMGTNEGLYRFNRATGTFSHYPVDKRLSGSAEENDVYEIYEVAGGMLWIGTGEGGLFRFERATGAFKKYRITESHLPVPIGRPASHFMTEDRRGVLWVASGGGRGVGRYDRAKDRFTFYTHDPKDPGSFSNNHATAIHEDRSGALWFGTWWGGVNKLDRARKSFIHYTHEPADPASLSNKSVFGLCEDMSGAVWVGTMDGLNRFDRQTHTFTHYKHDPHNPHSLADNYVKAVLEDSRGTIWVGTNAHGLDRLDPVTSGGQAKGKERFVHYTHDPRDPNSLGSNSILSLFEDKSGRLWIGTTDAGLDEFDRESGTFTHYKHDPRDEVQLDPKIPNSLGWNWVNAIYEDKSGTLWVGVAGEGLNRLDRATGKFTHYWDYHWEYRRYSNSPKNLSKGLSYGSVHSIYEDRKGTLWVGTAAGLNRFDRSTETFTHFTVRDGLASDFIGAILEDDSGCLWLKTGKGVSKFNPSTGSFRNYDASDGVTINPTWGKASCKNKSGEMYFGGTNGFIRFHPDSIRDNLYVPPIVLTGFKKFDKPVPLDTAISEKKILQLSYKDNVISFEFAALNYTSPEKNQYAYKLEGFDKDWTYCGTRRYASYTNLDGGSYVFRVKGSNNDGLWNEEGTSIAVIITPPFWKTWWFTTLFFVVTAALVGGMIWYLEITRLRRRLRASEQEHALERERLRISRDMHDEVGANLTEIAILSERVRQDIQNPTHADAHAQKIAEKSRELIDRIGEIIWAINPNNDTLDHLAGYIREFASEYFGMTSIACRCDFPDQIPSSPLSAEVRRNTFLILKEAINNVVKHSGATSAELSCRISDQGIEFSIRDNGRGFTGEHCCRQGNGFRNMKKRSEEINGNLQIETQMNRGTQIRLTVPLS